jgi:hypothetical protein
LKHLAEPAGSRHRLAYLAGAIALIALSLLMIAGRAHADQLYWTNQSSIVFSRLNQTEGGELANSHGTFADPEGTVIDTANNRIYVVDAEVNRILWFALDGSGNGTMSTHGAPLEDPKGLSLDPGTQTIYWANDVPGGSIGWAKIDESAGGTLSTGVAHVSEPIRTAIDVVDGRLYWWNEGTDEFSWASTSDTGVGGNLTVTAPNLPEEAEENEGMQGIALDPIADELFWLDGESESLGSVALAGGKGEEIEGATNQKNFNNAYGLAYDVNTSRFYWGNFGVGTAPEHAIGTATLLPNTGGSFAPPASTPVEDPSFPVLLATPGVAGEPEVTAAGTTLSCSQGFWEEDQPGSFTYQAPTSYSYQWRKGSTAIPGATGSSYAVTETGTYSCRVTAENAAGSASQSSNGVAVTIPPKAKPITPIAPVVPKPAAVGAKLVSGKPVKVKAGGTAVVKVDLKNSGGTTSDPVKVCGKLNKQAKKGLKAPACVKVKGVAAGKTVVAKLKVKTLGSALGTYKFTVAVSGAVKKNLTAKVQVTAPKPKK